MNDLGFSTPRRAEFWITLLIFAIVLWSVFGECFTHCFHVQHNLMSHCYVVDGHRLRYLPHSLGLWLYLSSFRITILSSEWTAYYVFFEYSGEFYGPALEAGSVVIGTVFLMAFFFFVVLVAWVVQKLFGYFPLYLSRALWALGLGMHSLFPRFHFFSARNCCAHSSFLSTHVGAVLRSFESPQGRRWTFS